MRGTASQVFRRVLALLVAALLVAGLVPGLPEPPRALAELTEGHGAALGPGEEERPLGGGSEGTGVPDGDDNARPLGGKDDPADVAVPDEDAESDLANGLAIVVQEEGPGAAPEASADSGPVDGTGQGEGESTLGVQAVSVSNPRVVPESGMAAGQVATWDCVWFGSYPQTEVTGSDNVYKSLQNAGWDGNGDATVGGKKYRRVSRSDAVRYGARWSSDGYGSAAYRYFRYEPIKWRVLKVSGSTALLVADQALDNRVYNTNHTSVTWATSSVRSWLNGYGAASNQPGTDYSHGSFLGTAFSSGERSAILTTDVVNADNTYDGTAGGAGTRDRVFLLSEAEACGTAHGFASGYSTYDEARRCRPTDFAHAIGAYRNSDSGGTYEGNCWWWLRSPGWDSLDAALVGDDGSVYNVGSVDGGDAVRPALNLNLASPHLSWAGTVSSNGDVDEQAAPGEGGPGEVYISHGFDPSVHGNSFIHTNGNGSGKTVNKELFETTLGNGQRDEVWHKGQCGFYGVGNVFIMPGDLLRFFGDMRTNPIEYATLGICSLMPWKGSCLGLSTAIALSFKGGSEALDRAHKARFCEVGPPYLNAGLLSLIQCYHYAGNLYFSPKASWDPSAFVLKGSVDEVARTIIEDVSRDGVSALRFHNGDGNHAILATSVRGDLSADNGEIEIGLFDVNSAGCFLKGSQEPYFVGDSQLTMKLRKTGGRYVGFEFLDVLGTKKRQDSRNERYVYNEQNTSLKVYDYKKESSPPLGNVIKTSITHGK